MAQITLLQARLEDAEQLTAMMKITQKIEGLN